MEIKDKSETESEVKNGDCEGKNGDSEVKNGENEVKNGVETPLKNGNQLEDESKSTKQSNNRVLTEDQKQEIFSRGNLSLIQALKDKNLLVKGSPVKKLSPQEMEEDTPEISDIENSQEIPSSREESVEKESKSKKDRKNRKANKKAKQRERELALALPWYKNYSLMIFNVVKSKLYFYKLVV